MSSYYPNRYVLKIGDDSVRNYKLASPSCSSPLANESRYFANNRGSQTYFGRIELNDSPGSLE